MIRIIYNSNKLYSLYNLVSNVSNVARDDFVAFSPWLIHPRLWFPRFLLVSLRCICYIQLSLHPTPLQL